VSAGAKALVGIGVVAAINVTLGAIRANVVKGHAWNYAKSLSNDKGILNLGCGGSGTAIAGAIAYSPQIKVNVDLQDGMPGFLQLDLEQGLPFADKQFSVSYTSHVLEHLENWQLALEEACRVADFVVVVLPHPLSLSGWLQPAHKQHFSRSDIEQMGKNYNNVVVFY